MNENKISIIIPAYNIAGYLPRCLDSVLAQDYEDLEIIVVDDGSADETGQIIDEYARQDGRIIAIHQENSGVTRARAAGLRGATGEWIGFVDGDDYIEPDMFSFLLANAIKHGAGISHCGYRMVFPDRVDYYYNTGCLAEQDKITALKELLSGERIEPGLCNKLFHKTLLHSLFHSGVLESGVRINEDLLMNYYLFKAAEKSVYEDRCPYHYMIRPGSAATGKGNRRHCTDPVRVFEWICEDTKSEAELYRIALRRYTGVLMRGAAQREFPDVAQQCREKLKKQDREELSKSLSVKNRCMVWMILYCRPLYRLVRWGYERVTGINHRYDA